MQRQYGHHYNSYNSNWCGNFKYFLKSEMTWNLDSWDYGDLCEYKSNQNEMISTNWYIGRDFIDHFQDIWRHLVSLLTGSYCWSELKSVLSCLKVAICFFLQVLPKSPKITQSRLKLQRLWKGPGPNSKHVRSRLLFMILLTIQYYMARLC